MIRCLRIKRGGTGVPACVKILLLSGVLLATNCSAQVHPSSLWQDDAELVMNFQEGPFRAPAGTVTDWSIYRNDADTNSSTQAGAVYLPNSSPGGGGCYQFMTSTSQITPQQDALSPGTGPITIAIWFNTTQNFSPGDQGALYYDYGSPANNLVALDINSDNKMEYTIRDSSGNSIDVTGMGPAVTNGVWHLATLVRDSQTSLAGYLDGIQIGTGTNASLGSIDVSDGNTGTGNEPMFGSYPHGGGSALRGKLGQVRIYKRALSAQEVRLQYETGLVSQ